MKVNSHIPWRLIISCLLLFGFLALVSSPTAVKAAPTIDGVIDAEYGTAVASDPIDPPQGNANLDLGDLYLTHDETYLYIAYTINADIDASNWGKYLMYIDTTNDTNGATVDAWGRNVIVNDPHKPEFSINTYVDAVPYDTGAVQFFTWDQGNGSWSGASTITAAAKVAGATSVIEWQVALADIGNPENIWVELFSTGGGADPAQDTINDPADDWNAVNWVDQSDLDVSTAYSLAVAPPIVIDGIIEADYGDPLASDPVDPPQGNANLDMGDLYVTDDVDNFYIAYTINADIGTTNWGKYLLYIDTTNDSNGATSDAWGRNVVVDDPHKPEFSINNYVDGGVFDTSTVQYFSWNGAGWDNIGSVEEAALATGSTSVIEYRVSKASLGNPETIWLEVFSTGGGADPAQDTINEPADDWNATNWVDQSTLAVSTEYPAPVDPPISTECASGAAQDNNIFWDDLGHNSRDTLYRTPGGAVEAGTAVSLRLRTACGDLTSAQVRIWDDLLNAQTLADMTLVASDSQYDWWETAVPVSADPTIYYYRFIANDGSSTAYYEDNDTRDGGWGQTFGSSPDYGWQLTMYDPTFQTPDWVKNGIMYQIFPERFRDGDALNNTPAGSFHYDIAGGSIVRSDDTDWHTPICDPRDAAECEGIYGQNFYGGDLQGIVDKLDYLQDLGVTVLYLNPIFESPSNHKYDTTDFGVIDDNFGDLALFQTLTTEAHNRGINIVLDGVFNHTSSDSVYFDRYNRYPAPDGACESEVSTYRDWFYFEPAAVPGTGSCAGDTDYEAWFGFDSLPKMDAANQDVRDLIWDDGVSSIARYWMQWADGWRLDVAGDVDPGETNDPNNEYWEGFRDAVHTTNPDAYIVGEEWNVATAWTLGQEWDATMNYQFGSAIMSFWRDTTFVDNDHNAGSSAGTLAPITPSQLDARLLNLEERYPEEAYQAMMNLLGSHDTNRALFMLDENTGANDDTLYDNPNYDWSDAITRLKGVALLQMTLPGSPTIYYGDEVGLVGPVTWDGSTWQDDPYNRLPYPWLDETGTPFYTHLQTQPSQDALFAYYQTLTSARLSHAALRTGSMETLLTDDANNVYAFARLMADYSDAAVVMVNRAGAA
ncbi:MAG: glycoside hydrolase family 13 protein, partial [Chloroflexi bacterium]|nr:glycoside hydrolase family 13 protein [Chloroflexota bacterium]